MVNDDRWFWTDTKGVVPICVVYTKLFTSDHYLKPCKTRTSHLLKQWIRTTQWLINTAINYGYNPGAQNGSLDRLVDRAPGLGAPPDPQNSQNAVLHIYDSFAIFAGLDNPVALAAGDGMHDVWAATVALNAHQKGSGWYPCSSGCSTTAAQSCAVKLGVRNVPVRVEVCSYPCPLLISAEPWSH